jgi:hypothetical protein
VPESCGARQGGMNSVALVALDAGIGAGWLRKGLAQTQSWCSHAASVVPSPNARYRPSALTLIAEMQQSRGPRSACSAPGIVTGTDETPALRRRLGRVASRSHKHAQTIGTAR